MSRVVLAIACALILGLVGFALGLRHGRGVVQAKWDAERAAQAVAASTEQARLDTRAAAAQDAIDEIGRRYAHADDVEPPRVADVVAADLAAGTLRVRYECAAPGADPVPGTADRAAGADGAAATAAQDRREAALAAVRAGDACDAREWQLGEQVRALQAVLRAEREDPSR